jgi:hypothetical protein
MLVNAFRYTLLKRNKLMESGIKGAIGITLKNHRSSFK